MTLSCQYFCSLKGSLDLRYKYGKEADHFSGNNFQPQCKDAVLLETEQLLKVLSYESPAVLDLSLIPCFSGSD